MKQPQLLVVDDEEDIREVVRYNMALEGYDVTLAATGEEGVHLAQKIKPDLILLDLMLPGIDGLEVCRTLKRDKSTSKILILILSALGEESHVVTGLETGADDYLAKPFSPKILAARVKSLLRRKNQSVLHNEDDVVYEGIVMDLRRHEVKIHGDLVEMTSTEFKILHPLIIKAGWVFTRSQIVDEVHGEDYPVTDRSIDVQMVGLRKKLLDYGSYIETVRGVGYRFKEKNTE